MPAQHEDQLAMDERRLEDRALEDALENRLELRLALAEARTGSREADAAAALLLRDVDLSEPVRIGRFRITKQVRAARAVAFEVGPSDRVIVELYTGEDGTDGAG